MPMAAMLGLNHTSAIEPKPRREAPQDQDATATIQGVSPMRVMWIVLAAAVMVLSMSEARLE